MSSKIYQVKYMINYINIIIIRIMTGNLISIGCLPKGCYIPLYMVQYVVQKSSRIENQGMVKGWVDGLESHDRPSYYVVVTLCLCSSNEFTNDKPKGM